MANNIVIMRPKKVAFLTLKRPTLLTLFARLFVAAHAPVDTDVLVTYTAIEATFGGYVPIPLNNWGVAGLVGGTATIVHPMVSWTVTAAPLTNAIYGVFVTTDPAGANELFWAARNTYAAGFPMANPGVDTYTDTITFTDDNAP